MISKVFCIAAIAGLAGHKEILIRACEADCFFGILILQTLCLLNHPFSLSLFLFAMA